MFGTSTEASAPAVFSFYIPNPPPHTHTTGKLCIDGYIALQELIVPIVVGGILAILLVLIFVAYIVDYISVKV